MEEEKIFKVKRIYIEKWDDICKQWTESDVPIVENDNIKVPIITGKGFNIEDNDSYPIFIGIECK